MLSQNRWLSCQFHLLKSEAFPVAMRLAQETLHLTLECNESRLLYVDCLATAKIFASGIPSWCGRMTLCPSHSGVPILVLSRARWSRYRVACRWRHICPHAAIKLLVVGILGGPCLCIWRDRALICSIWWIEIQWLCLPTVEHFVRTVIGSVNIS
jgi:hypothetical protein